MKKLLLPLTIFVLGLAIADVFFGVDVRELFQGFGQFLADLFIRGGK